jgi:hypothetical protein
MGPEAEALREVVARWLADTAKPPVGPTDEFMGV